MPGFATTTSSNFIRDFIGMVNHADEPELAAWLFAHAGEMDEAMFFREENDWLALAPHQILALRAVAPKGVFTETAKAGYLARIGGDHDRSKIVKAMFGGDDHAFIRDIPSEYADLKPLIIQLTQLAYKYGIRTANPRVNAM